MEISFRCAEAEQRNMDPYSPLSVQLQAGQWPARFASVKLPTFAGEFFMQYETVVESCGRAEAINTKAFPIVSEGITGAWYTRLAPGSISSWSQLME